MPKEGCRLSRLQASSAGAFMITVNPFTDSGALDLGSTATLATIPLKKGLPNV